MRKPCVGAKLVLRFQALIAHAFLDRAMPIFVPQIGMYIRINMSKTDFIYSKYITIRQLNCQCMQVNILLSSFLKVYVWFMPLILILCIIIIYNYHIIPCTYKWVFSFTCVYYPVP